MKINLNRYLFSVRSFSFLRFLASFILPGTLLSCAQTNEVTQLQAAVQSPGVLITNSATDSGYVLFAPHNSDTTYLIDKNNNVFNYWVTDAPPGMSVYLLPNGSLLRSESINRPPARNCGFPGGRFVVHGWDNKFLWGHDINSPFYQQTHDIFPMPNGNVLVDVWEFIPNKEVWTKKRDTTQLFDGGLWSGMLMEVQQDCDTCKTGHIVWKWRFWDHLVLDSAEAAKHPEKLYVNYIGTPDDAGTSPTKLLNLSDWIHMNAIVYNPALNQIMMSSRNLNEIYIIEHTDSAIASRSKGGVYGCGGDFLYRWGAPAAYFASGKQQLFGQHSPYWVDTTSKTDRRIMINNDGFYGSFSGTNYTSTDIATMVTAINTPFNVDSGKYLRQPNQPFGPFVCDTIYVAPNDSLWSSHQGSAQKLPNGNILICAATPEGGPSTTSLFYEIDNTTAHQIVWAFRLYDRAPLFRCHQYETAYINKIVKKHGLPKH